MTDIEQMVTEFHRVMGMTIGTGGSVEVPEKDLRYGLVKEEYEELRAEWGNGDQPADTAKWAKEAADLVYVIVGAFVTFGIPFNDVFDEVHRSNLSKVGGERRDDGKVLKGPNYSPADIAGVLGR